MYGLIGINCLLVVIWFALCMYDCSKKDNYDNFKSNWTILTVLTVLFTTGIYLVIYQLAL